MILPHQCRAARAILGWSQAELAKNASVSEGTVKHFEAEKRGIQKSSMTLLQQIFETSGIEFLGLDGVRKS